MSNIDNDYEYITDRDGRRKKVLRDKARTRVPMMLRDAAPTGRTRMVDTANGDELAGCRPGWRLPVGDAFINDEKEIAYHDYLEDLTDDLSRRPARSGK